MHHEAAFLLMHTHSWCCSTSSREIHLLSLSCRRWCIFNKPTSICNHVQTNECVCCCCLSLPALWWEGEAGGTCGWLECILFWWFDSSSELTVLTSIFGVVYGCLIAYPLVCSQVDGHIMERTRKQWGSCGLVCSGSTQRTLTLENMLSVSVNMTASPRSINSGHPNTLQLKVSCRIKKKKLCICRSCPVLSYMYTFFTDPFDLNHNLGAGLSRKSMERLYFLEFMYF